MIVGECFDGWLSDARALAVRPEHALEAIAAAGADEVGEGALGAGTGTTCFGYKAGIGGASRRSGGHALGCLVCSNYGSRRDLHLLVGRRPGRGRAAASGGGRLDRDRARHRRAALGAAAAPLAARAGFGLGRAGSFAANASGEYALAFSTAQRLAHRSESEREQLSFLRDDSVALRELFEAVGEVVHEAVLNSLCTAAAMEGRDGHRVDALPYELLDGRPGAGADVTRGSRRSPSSRPSVALARLPPYRR